MLRILSLCDHSGIWSAPYKDAGYEVVTIDIQHGQDVRLLKYLGDVRGIIAQPPCTEFASSGARWWQSKGEAPLLQALAVVDACTRVILAHNPVWWVLENPIGRLSRFLAPAQYVFHPHQYGDTYTKRTNLWGHFAMPQPLHRTVTEPNKILRMSPGPDRANRRSLTSAPFAQAFFQANP